jgi:prevent-host-death family protein
MPTAPDRNPPDAAQTVETMPASQARREWAQLLNRVQRDGAPVLIEKNGVPVAALISPRELDFLLSERANRERDFAVIDELQAAYAAAFADVPDDELERQIEKAVAEARAELRAEALAREQAAEATHAS